MDRKGYEAINSAFASEGIEATVTPVPEPGGDEPHVTIETATNIQPSLVLNALVKAGLMHGFSADTGRSGRTHLAHPAGPQLRPVLGGVAGSITLEDTRSRHAR